MTAYKIFKNKYFLYVMCIFVVIAAWGTLVFHAVDNALDTHFFAVHFIEFANPHPTQSLSQKSSPQFVAWVQRTDYITENTFDYFVNNTFISTSCFFGFLLLLGHALNSASLCKRKTIRYLRI